MAENLIANFKRQRIKDKELIVILNKNDINFVPPEDNIRIYRLDEEVTLGECLNFGASLARYDVVAKFDDDDFYSEDYASNSFQLLTEKKAGVVGKAGIFVYFKNEKMLTLFRHRFTNMFLKNKKVFLAGGTLVFRKEAVSKAPFQAVNVGEDVQFQRDCIRNGISVYSGGIHDYVLIRYQKEHQHSWNIDDDIFQNHCKKIAITDSFEEYVRKGEERP